MLLGLKQKNTKKLCDQKVIKKRGEGRNELNKRSERNKADIMEEKQREAGKSIVLMIKSFILSTGYLKIHPRTDKHVGQSALNTVSITKAARREPWNSKTTQTWAPPLCLRQVLLVRAALLSLQTHRQHQQELWVSWHFILMLIWLMKIIWHTHTHTQRSICLSVCISSSKSHYNDKHGTNKGHTHALHTNVLMPHELHFARSQTEYVYFCKAASSLANKTKMQHPFEMQLHRQSDQTLFQWGLYIYFCILSSRLSDIWICEHNTSPPSPCVSWLLPHTRSRSSWRL